MSSLATESTLMNSSLILDDNDYTRFCEFLETVCGITLGDNKSYLVNSRLKHISEQYQFKTLGQMVDAVKRNVYRDLKFQIVDAMTTNETSWFRDSYPFDILKEDILPELSGKPADKVRIWSAACSYGHEPYSISIAFQEYIDRNLGQFRNGIEIVGTDISKNALQEARAADYDDLNLARGLSSERKKKYFLPTENGMKVSDKIKSRVRFQELNLLESYGLLGKFDVVFCRNVLIYFSNENKSKILAKIANIMPKDAFLFPGASEPIANYSDDFEMVSMNRNVAYRRR